MSLSKKTDLGEIKISDEIIAEIISDAISHPDLASNIWPATERGRQIGLLPKIVDAEFASNIETSYTEDEKVNLEFSVIVRFGVSISKVTKELSDRIVEKMDYILGITPDEITINIAGVRSKQIARRNIKAVYRYGTD